MTNEDKAAAAMEVINAFYDIVVAYGDQGCPAGPFYARVMHQVSLGTFENIMGLLVASGKVRYANHCYYAIRPQ